MTKISRDDVVRLATMSSLQLVESEIDNLTTDIEKIIEYVEQLNELDTEGVLPTYQVNQQQNVWRDDIPQPSLGTETLLSLAPERIDTHIKVPKVL